MANSSVIRFDEIFAELKKLAISDELFRKSVQEYEEADPLEQAMMSSQITYLMNQPFFRRMPLSSALNVAFKVDASIYPVLVNYVAKKEEGIS